VGDTGNGDAHARDRVTDEGPATSPRMRDQHVFIWSAIARIAE